MNANGSETPGFGVPGGEEIRIDGRIPFNPPRGAQASIPC